MTTSMRDFKVGQIVRVISGYDADTAPNTDPPVDGLEGVVVAADFFVHVRLPVDAPHTIYDNSGLWLFHPEELEILS